MARRIKEFMITADGRDKGKLFELTEMSATDAEDWAARAFLALANDSVDIGSLSPDMGMQGIAALGFAAFSKLKYDNIKPLMDKMFSCVRIIPDPSRPIPRTLVEDDIEEVATRFAIRLEVFALHTGFSLPGAKSDELTSGGPSTDSSNTRMSRPSSALSSRPVRHR